MNQWSDRTKALVLVALAFLIYGFGIGRGFDFDDFVYISKNPLLRRPDAIHAFWFTSEAFNYYPLFWTLLRGQWLLWGDHPLGYHLVNLIMHSVNAVLVWRIARLWRLPGAWWIAALFAVHPVNVQTLAWAAEQKNTWSFFFMALALLAFLQHMQEGRWSKYVLALLWFAAALACKTSTVFLPVFLTIFYLFGRGKAALPVLLRLVPMYALGFAAGVTTVWFEKHRVIAKSLLGTFSLWQRMEVAGATFWFYLGKALVPIHLTPMYHGWVDTAAAPHILPGLLLVALLTACALFWRRIGAPVALGITYYALMLFPLLGVFDTNYFTYSLVADHWQYHALPGIIVAVVAALSMAAEKWPRLAAYPNATGTVAVLGVAALASAHFAHFEDPRSLWSYVVEENPDAWLAWYNLGNSYSDDHHYPEAISAYRKSQQIRPDYERTPFNLASALAADKQLEEADRVYFEAEKQTTDDPDIYVNRGVVLLRLGRENDAAGEFQRSLQLDPAKVSAHVNLVAILLKRGQIDEAARHLEMVPSLSEANAHRIANAIGAAAQQTPASKPALQHFAQRACELNGNHPDLRAALAGLETGTPISP